ncbi:amidohydrolase family protein [Marinobacter salinisoli]|uniref:amidohydrolase family protein n=1 Tax=Marinobacter salinisoli TaxID=2769486 RepID=UPI001D1934BB|nr:hypothetical protein [Marinobacter salinisoli]
MKTRMAPLLRIALAVSLLSFALPALAQDTDQARKVLFKNVNVFDGKGEAIAEGMSVLVEGNTISKIAQSVAVPEDATVIDGSGRTLMPGLIDAHAHLMHTDVP